MAESNPDDEREEIQRQLEWLRHQNRRFTLHPSTLLISAYIVRNANGYPLKLRSVINETHARWPFYNHSFGEDMQFKNVVYNAFLDFFCGRPIPEDYIERYSSNDYKDWQQYEKASSTVNNWCGLDSCDTPDEAELAIRLFPWERLKFPTGHLEAMSKHSQTVSFIPIFMEIYMERRETYYLYDSFDAVVKGCWYLMAPETVRGETFDRKCLTVLDEIFTRSSNNGLVRSTVIQNLLAAGPIHPIYNERIFVTTLVPALPSFKGLWVDFYKVSQQFWRSYRRCYFPPRRNIVLSQRTWICFSQGTISQALGEIREPGNPNYD